MSEYIKLPVHFVADCDACGLDHINDANGDSLFLLAGGLDTQYGIALEAVVAINSHDALIAALRSARRTVVYYMGDGETVTLAEIDVALKEAGFVGDPS